MAFLVLLPECPGADQREATHPCFLLREEVLSGRPDRLPGSDTLRRRFRPSALYCSQPPNRPASIRTRTCPVPFGVLV